MKACNLYFKCKENFALFPYGCKSHIVAKQRKLCVLMICDVFLVFAFMLVLILCSSCCILTSTWLVIGVGKSY